MLLKKVSNTCSAKTYCINHLTHTNCRSVDTGSYTGLLTD